MQFNRQRKDYDELAEPDEEEFTWDLQEVIEEPDTVEIGLQEISIDNLNYVHEELKKRPPKRFDIERIIRTYKARNSVCGN